MSRPSTIDYVTNHTLMESGAVISKEFEDAVGRGEFIEPEEDEN